MSSIDDHRADEIVSDLNFLDPSAAAHPQPVFRRLRERCPIGKPIPGGGVCISRYEDVMTALKRPDIFSSVMPAGIIGFIRLSFRQERLFPVEAAVRIQSSNPVRGHFTEICQVCFTQQRHPDTAFGINKTRLRGEGIIGL